MTNNNHLRVAIIGGGAAGCFAAVNLKRRMPEADICVLESGRKLLAKVAVTGGGRCNLTNSFNGVKSLAAVYPRGERLMKRLFHEFSHKDTMKWFEQEGVRLVTQGDECVFPVSQDAMEIVGTLERLMRRGGVKILTEHRVKSIGKHESGFRIAFTDEAIPCRIADRVIVTTGGSPKASGLDMLRSLGLETVEPVPSLFGICLPGHSITQLTGTVTEDVTVGIAGTKTRARGALLITHWGMSGPAILRLSSYAARLLNERGYKARLLVNWLGDANEEDIRATVAELAIRNPQKKLSSAHPQQLNARLWCSLLEQSGTNADMRWGELGSKGMNKITSTLAGSVYDIDGKNRFKEEFVTCGGVALSNINPRTMECKTAPGLYFAGEVLDVDAVTGGFNLQAAWTMGFVAAKAIAEAHQQDSYDKKQYTEI